MTSKERPQQLVPKYRQLIRTTEQVVENARAVLKKTERVGSIDLMTQMAITTRFEMKRHKEIFNDAPTVFKLTSNSFCYHRPVADPASQ